MDASTITILIIGLAVGLLAGAGGAWIWARFSGKGSTPDARQQAAYREEVADHFVKTAELVNRLTDSYKEVFDHLRDGAGRLVDEDTLRERLAHEEDKDVTLHLIGYRESGPGDETAPEPRGPESGTGDAGNEERER